MEQYWEVHTIGIPSIKWHHPTGLPTYVKDDEGIFSLDYIDKNNKLRRRWYRSKLQNNNVVNLPSVWYSSLEKAMNSEE